MADRRSEADDSPRHVAALEVGGTHVGAAVVDLSSGRVVGSTRQRRPLDSGGTAAQIVGTLVEAAAPVVTAAGGTDALGVAMPGPFDYRRGIGRFHGVAKFESLNGFDIGAALKAGLGGTVARISFVNDADAFALGEWASGGAIGHRRVVAITLGTGIGSGFLEDGRLVTDDPRVPPEGSVHRLSVDGRPLEDVVSRRALLRRARATIPELAVEADVLDLANLAHAGDERALRVFDAAFEALGAVLAAWLVRFEATSLIVGGSMAGSWDLVGPPLDRGLRGAEPSLAGLTIRRASDAEDSALIGAAVHARGRSG